MLSWLGTPPEFWIWILSPTLCDLQITRREAV